MSFIELENTTGMVQKVYDKVGEMYYINPRGMKAFPPDVAELFLTDRRGKVRVASDAEVPPLLVNEKPMWIANMTGNPFYPKEWEIETIDKNDLPVIKKIPNANSVARKLTWEIQVGQGNDPYGRVSELLSTSTSPHNDFNLPPLSVTLRARQRMCIGHRIGQVIMQRDALLGDRGHGQVVECRPPTSFEPSMAWDLPKILFYARMVAEEDFGKVYLLEELKANDRRASPTRPFRLEEVVANEEWAESLKDTILSRLFYRIVDLDYGLPTQVAFERHYDASLMALNSGERLPSADGKRTMSPEAAEQLKQAAAQARKRVEPVADVIPPPDPAAVQKMQEVVAAGLQWESSEVQSDAGGAQNAPEGPSHPSEPTK